MEINGHQFGHFFAIFTWPPFSANLVIVCPLYNGKERKTMHYSMLIRGSPTNSSFTWINPYKNPTITSMTALFRPKEAKAMFNNVDTTNVVTNSNDETVTIPAGYYTLSEIIEAVGAEMVKVLPLTSMTIEDDHVRFNDQSK